MANASDWGCSTMTVQPSVGSVAATPKTAPRNPIYSADAVRELFACAIAAISGWPAILSPRATRDF